MNAATLFDSQTLSQAGLSPQEMHCHQYLAAMEVAAYRRADRPAPGTSWFELNTSAQLGLNAWLDGFTCAPTPGTQFLCQRPPQSLKVSQSSIICHPK
jgi:hypothetical protein